MYTVIVADDEEEIRRGIIENVRWEQVGFQVIGEAANGADALELAEKRKPDLLITDIRMPFLSGIELARQLREIRPTVQIAFLSGFDEFSYAQQAIQYNIVSYMLKPISSKELEAELLKIKDKIDARFAEFAKNSIEQSKLEKTEFLVPLLLDSFQQGKEAEEDMLQNAIRCGFIRKPVPENFRYVVMITSIVNDDLEDMTSRASVNAVDMILKKYVRYTSCYLKGRVVSVLAATPAGFNKYLHILVEEIVQSVERIMKMTCRIGVSRSVPMLSDCREGYLEAMNAISYSKDEENSVYYISDEEKGDEFSLEEFQEIVDTIETLLRGGKSEELEEYLQELEYKIRVGKNSIMMSSLLVSQMVATVYKVVYAAAGDSGVQKVQTEYPLNEIQDMERMAERFRNMKKMCMFAKEVISEQRKNSSELICEKVLEIITSRYKENNLSIAVLSAEIGVSPNYLSSLIKKMTGNTFVELLTKKRIEKAREMLCCTSMKIREITEECGYRDQYYFSHCFKKITGMSPNSCRREYEQNK